MSEQTHALPVPETSRGARVDVFIGERLGLSRASLKALFERGAVRVDGRRARKGDRLEPGVAVQVTLEAAPDEPARATADPSLRPNVLHADDDLVFVDKPAGVPSHPLAAHEVGTVANALVAAFPECGAASEDPREGGLCHRLDTLTSGVLLAARSRPAWSHVRAQFSRQAVDKRYWALARGPLCDEGELVLPLRHSPRHADRVEGAVSDERARPAHSELRVLARRGELVLVEVRIHTGVLHQVRAHLAAIGAPIVGDALYGGAEEPGLPRFFLHARTLCVTHPSSGDPLTVESPLPRELGEVLERYGLTPPSP